LISCKIAETGIWGMTKYTFIRKIVSLWTITGLLIYIAGCKDFTDDEIYKPPANLEGKLYDQLLLEENSDLSTFAACLERTGISDIITKLIITPDLIEIHPVLKATEIGLPVIVSLIVFLGFTMLTHRKTISHDIH